MKKRISGAFPVGILIAGLFLLLYPAVSDRVHTIHQARIIAAYIHAAEELDTGAYTTAWNSAQEYNRALTNPPAESSVSCYNDLLNIYGNGLMGYLEIPRLKLLVPIYHGTDADVLQTSAGHLDWSSLPVGGGGCHCVITAHRGLPNARLFTDLDKLIPGDKFFLHILKETLTYEVDKICIVLPHETGELRIREGEDLCTLVTCTPYGINTHRLLVRGRRVQEAVIHKKQDQSPASYDTLLK